MRSSVVIVLAALFAGCGTAKPQAQGGGGAGGMGGVGGQGGVTSSTTGGAGGCQELHLGKLHSLGSAYLEADIVENVDGPKRDVLSMSFWYSPTQTTWTGVQDLGSLDNENFSTCTTCFNVYSDAIDAVTPVNPYFQTAGTFDLGSTLIDFDGSGYAFITNGTIANAHFVEVTVDLSTRISTPVPNGKCFDIVMGTFSMLPPPVGWTCEPALYDNDSACDCNCGIIDQDCSDPSQVVNGCENGQTCDPVKATCVGVPLTWTCAASAYGGGAANGCDCNCGTHDPDCSIVPTPAVNHCNAGETCNSNDKCLPPGFTCAESAYDDTSDVCDCGCGIRDPDCLTQKKSSCSSCNDTGSCDTAACTDAASKINATNNAVCN